MGTRPVGRTRQRWQEDITEHLKKLKVKNRKEAGKGRRTWRDLAEKVKNPQRVVVPNDDDDDNICKRSVAKYKWRTPMSR